MKKLLFLFSVIVVYLFSAMTAYAAIDKVRCVLWQGDPAKQHTAISGVAVRLAGVITTTDTSQIWYRWVYGDGSSSAVTPLSGKTTYNVSTDRIYTGGPDTPFTAILQVDAVDSTMANAVEDTFLIKIQADTLDARANMAIDKGLWYLYTHTLSNSYCHTLDGSPYMIFYTNSSGYVSNFFASSTASAVQAFAINNHKVDGDFAQDPYAEAVKFGMNWLIQGWYRYSDRLMLRALAINSQTAGNPDTNGNGYGIEVRDYNTSRPIYQGGQIMDAIIASGVKPTDDTGRDFTGRGSTWSYGELLQDMCDMYAWGQVDSTTARGGWQYSWNSGSDNSAAQWAAIGMIPAQQHPWNCTVPDWVKTENAIWLNYSYSGGHFGYTSAGSQHDYYLNTTPSGMVQMAMDGQIGFDDPDTPGDDRDPKWIGGEKWVADRWNHFLHNGSIHWAGPLTYGWYAFAKAMRLAVPQGIERISTTGGVEFDWYNGNGTTHKGMAQRIVESQYSTGNWNGSLTGAGTHTTAWMIIILKPALFKTSPIACFSADPNPTYAGFTVSFDPSCSNHSETGKDIGNLTKFEWDWDNDGVYDQETPTPDVVTHAFACASVPCIYPVTLKVTDDDTPALTATYTLNIEITNPPHPPVADANGPYMVSLCDGDTLTLDGSGSFDPNQGEHEAGCIDCPDDTVTAWDWDLDGAPYDYDTKSGVSPTLTSTEINTLFSAGSNDVGLRVSDNTEDAYPTSGEPNLTDTGFSTVMVYDDCGELCTLNAAVKLGKVQLVWSAAGGADSYDIYRSTAGPNSGFVLIADDHVTDYATYLDVNVVNGTTYWYRIVSSNGCGSKAARATPTTTRRRR